MEKDFVSWHKQKKYINNFYPRPFFHEREIWFCHIGVNVGFEQDGKGTNFLRPVMIIKKFNQQVFIGIPLTHSDKKGKYYFPLHWTRGISIVILSQIRLLDAKRLSYKVGTVSSDQFGQIIKKLKEFFP